MVRNLGVILLHSHIQEKAIINKKGTKYEEKTKKKCHRTPKLPVASVMMCPYFARNARYSGRPDSQC